MIHGIPTDEGKILENTGVPMGLENMAVNLNFSLGNNEGPFNFPVDLKNITVKENSYFSLHLTDSKVAGLRTELRVEGLDSGFVNDEPYPDRETAKREYEDILAQVRNGKYSLELHSERKVRLLVKDSYGEGVLGAKKHKD